jgi:hypothetical protein
MKLRKGLIFYYKTGGITYLRKHIDENHSKFSNSFEREVKFRMKGNLYVYSYLVHPFYFILPPKNLSKEMMWNNKSFGKSCTFDCEIPLALQFVKSVWPKCLILHLYPQIQFHSQKFFSHIVLLSLV